MRASLCGLLLLSWIATASADDKLPEVAVPGKVPPGTTALLKTNKGMHYFLRVPKSYHPKRGAQLIVFLHGSNMNGLSYLRSFEARDWANEAILACPNGEQGSDPYGANNFTFESAPYVAEVTRDVQAAFRTTQTYVGGYSQGGFLTYSVILHFPELFHGALPMAGDCWSQNEPNLWNDKPEVLANQKRIAIVIVHGKRDQTVRFHQGQHAYDVFLVMGFPKLRLIAPENLGHVFMPSPVDEALEWLDAMVAGDPVHKTRKAVEWAKEGQWGWAVQAARGVLELKKKPAITKRSATNIIKAAEAAAKKRRIGVQKAMQTEEPRTWLPKFWEFRHQFGATKAASDLLQAYDRLRERQRDVGTRLLAQAESLLRAKKREEAHSVLRDILKEAPASYEAYYALSWLQEK